MTHAKTLLLCSLFAFVATDLPEVGDHLEVRGLKYEYQSKAYKQDDTWYIADTLHCNSREPMCLSWPVAKIFVDNKSPIEYLLHQEFPVKSPLLFKEATIFFGANWNEPKDGIKCYVDESDLQSSINKFGERVSFISERGERVEMKLTALYDQPLHQATLQLETNGAADVLVEQLPGWQSSLSDLASTNWKIQPIKKLSAVFSGTKYAKESAGFLYRDDTTRCFFLCRSSRTAGTSPLVLTATVLEGKMQDIAICLVSKSGNENIGFISTCYAD